ncbi:MAG: hypothetical protein L0206_04035, partial [Actinobacteria bacterium]|nr:hypothetical protein [Actinomycetota bacterium]
MHAATPPEGDKARPVADGSPDLRAGPSALDAARAAPEFAIPFETAQPLVSVCVATCDRSELLVSR